MSRETQTTALLSSYSTFVACMNTLRERRGEQEQPPPAIGREIEGRILDGGGLALFLLVDLNGILYSYLREVFISEKKLRIWAEANPKFRDTDDTKFSIEDVDTSKSLTAAAQRDIRKILHKYRAVWQQDSAPFHK